MNNQYVISTRTILTTFLLGAAALVIYKILPIIILVLVSLVIVLAMEQPIEFFMRQKVMNKKISRGTATILAYFLLVLVTAAIITIGLPPVIQQAGTLIEKLVAVISSWPYFAQLNLQDISLTDIAPNLFTVSGNLFSSLLGGFAAAGTVISVVFISIYMSLDWDNIKSKLLGLLEYELRKEVAGTIEEIEINIGHWVKGQVILMLIIGALSFVGLVILDVDFPLALSLIAGLLEVVPFFGPIISLILAGIIGFSISPAKGVAVVALFVLIQQIENSFLVPKVMQRVSGFSPLVILLALLTGLAILGVLGGLLAIPLLMIISIIFKRAITYSPPIN